VKLFGTLREIVAAVFRKDGVEVTLKPNSNTYLGATEFQLPPKTSGNGVLVASGDIVNADISAIAGIAGSKIQAANGTTNAGVVSTGAQDFGGVKTFLSNPVMSGLTSSQAVVTDSSKNLASLNYGSTNTVSTLVQRDASGNFAAGTITANLTGNVSGSAASFTGSLSGEVTGTQSATIVASGVIDNDNIAASAGIVDTKLATISTAGKVANSATTATSSNTASAIVARDASGNFAAGTASLSGATVSGLTASQAVVTDASKNLSSLAYSANNTPSTLMLRDVAGSTSVNTLSAGNIDVTGLATMDKAYIDGASGGGFIEFEGQTVADVPAPTVGEARIFAGTDGKIYVRKAGSSAAEELGAGGSGEVNLVDTPSDAGQWVGVNATVTTNTTAANNPLAGVIDSSISIASSTLNGYARTRFTMPSALKNRKLKLEWFQIASSLSSGAYKVEVYTNASSDYSGAYTELALSTDSSGTSSIPNLNGKYSTTFDTNGSDYYEIRLVRTAASAATLYVANVVCGPGIQPQGAVVGEWVSYTPAFEGLGTVTNASARYRRVGDSMQVEFVATSGTNTAVQVNTILPGSLNWDSTKFVNNTNVGKFNTNNTPFAGVLGVFTSQGTTKVTLTADASFFAGSTGTTWANSTTFTGTFTVPIAEWAGSGTVQLAQNDVEYASNSNATNTAADTTSFAYGPTGSLIPNGAVGSAYSRTVKFQSVIQPTDVFIVQVDQGTGQWIDADRRLSAYTTQATLGYGIQGEVLDSTTYSVVFGAGGFRATGATYASNGAAWSGLSAWRWRVRKMSAGAAVGFGIVQPGTSAGLVSASGLPGNTTGNAIASGYVGERIFVQSTAAAVAAGNAVRAITVSGTPMTLSIPTAGVWLISGQAYFPWSGAPSGSSFVLSTVSSTSNVFTETGLNPNGITDAASMTQEGNAKISVVPSVRAIFSGPATIYLNAYSGLSVSATSAWATLMAVRIA
jgi:hypothetical protein